ncbi:sensor histidine kinase [Mucilaginibacter ginsenosidivorans]|uniref:Histidine kinase n=1 Tax=Mucilaginibacter ginsenosidivorans TaxID=398053 RepID=A0A5B8UX72_9SPHI|nr:histidine kinase [Mucilaginibacter ginsenosidivorans]QEC63757.1 histidine kinase [Mucilaginibacter ginsenosidivorans]
MIYSKKITNASGNVFKVSGPMIWISALFMGVLASIPKILQLHITIGELMIDASIAFLFTLFTWYFNLYQLPKYSGAPINDRFFSRRLALSLLVGIGLMIALVLLHQVLVPGYPLDSMLMMYEFRGILINLTIYVFLFLLYQNFHTQLISIELERTKADHVSAKFELLKQLVNPHFLFNSLNTLKSMVDMQDANASEFILKLSDFYRFTLENRVNDLITLDEELQILEAYLFLLKARFEDGIAMRIDLPLNKKGMAIPPFTLQLLVENCIKHNVISLEMPLQIKLYTDGEFMVMENNLQPKLKPEPSTGMGLENINERYLHLNHSPIIVERRADIFRVKLPVVSWKF